jgi:hypothetical protein
VETETDEEREERRRGRGRGRRRRARKRSSVGFISMNTTGQKKTWQEERVGRTG